MLDSIRVFRQVPRVVFGAGSVEKLRGIADARVAGGADYMVVLIDSVHRSTGLRARIESILPANALLVDVNTDHEPTTSQIDETKASILKAKNDRTPSLVVGIGGGSVLDISKAVSVVMTNPGPSTQYQGWDLVKNPALFKIGVPTLSGTGSESSRTAVLCSRDKKFGINSDYSMFDQVILDPQLLVTVPRDQRFHTGMDCYVHSVESITGSFINSFGRVFASSSLELSRNVFLGKASDEELMVASFFGGASVANAEVGVCHALSYGLSLVLGYRHGIANCIAFNVLDDFYHGYVDEFRTMMDRNRVQLPRDVVKGVSDSDMDKMIDMTLKMERPLTNALGERWKEVLTRDRIKELYKKM